MPSVIKCIVKGNKIEEVLLALDPFVLEPPVVQVITEKATSPVRKNLRFGDLKAYVFAYVEELKAAGNKTVTTNQLKETCMANGGQSNSYSYALNMLLKQKKLRKSKQPNTYEIVQ